MLDGGGHPLSIWCTRILRMRSTETTYGTYTGNKAISFAAMKKYETNPSGWGLNIGGTIVFGEVQLMPIAIETVQRAVEIQALLVFN